MVTAIAIGGPLDGQTVGGEGVLIRVPYPPYPLEPVEWTGIQPGAARSVGFRPVAEYRLAKYALGERLLWFWVDSSLWGTDGLPAVPTHVMARHIGMALQ